MAPGIYLVATPIGNLEDITLRALRVLREADVIACEDTRHTRKLLNRYDIRKPLVSYHEHNERARADELVARAQAGETVAVVSDAGLPAISDPGYRVVEAALAAGVAVTPIPGPTAIETALVASGLPSDAFRFGGFLPAKSGQRRKALEAAAAERATLVFYEAPHRIAAALEDAREALGDRQAVVARELTKAHEEFLRGRLSELHAEIESRDAVKGEIVLLIAGGDDSAPAPQMPLKDRVAELIETGVPRMDAIKAAAKQYGMSKREAYRLLET